MLLVEENKCAELLVNYEEYNKLSERFRTLTK